ncbi:MAG TPA: cytochrome P450 [Sphingobium sp.]|uniref:cytochrome P450 n=1 Tax=Sphingobium sp. TaxID=1912891 RepID=UPI002ED46A1D
MADTAQIEDRARNRLSDADALTLVTPSAYADDRIHDLYRRLRAENPVPYVETPGYDPFWCLTRHADIDFVDRNTKLFHTSDRASPLDDKRGVAALIAATGKPYFVRALTNMDPPDHMKYRLLTQNWFMPSNLRRMEEEMRASARACVDRMANAGGACDFVSEIAVHYPLQVIMQILGVHAEDYPLMLALTQNIFAPNDADMSGKENADEISYGENMIEQIGAITKYFLELTEERRVNPRDDLATVLAQAKVDGEPLGQMELVGYYIIVATAGHDTTSSSTACAMRALAEAPELLARVKADPSLIAGLVEEAIRWETPVKHFMRSAVADIEIGGRHLRANDWIMLCYASGNRDETVFDDPYSFSIDRKPGKNLAFGSGAHVCLGQHLAKLEMRILFEELLPRLDAVELAGVPRMIESVFVNGLKSLPIRYALR